MQNLELKYFKLISAIASEGSIAKAADKLFLTPSALSHQLKEIESQLNTKVFNRINKNLVLTDTGKLLLESSNVILKEVDRVTSEIVKQVKGESGTIRLGAECNTCFHWLPHILKLHQEEFPNVEFRLETNGTKAPLILLLNGKIDLGIVYRKSKDKNIVFTELFTDDVVALIPIEHSLSKRKYLTPIDFKDETYITHSTELQHSIFFEQFLDPKGVVPKKVMYIQLTEAVLEMINEGLGIAVMARWLVEPYIDTSKIKMIKIGRSGLKRKWYIATLKNELQSRPLIRFIEIIRENITTKLNNKANEF